MGLGARLPEAPRRRADGDGGKDPPHPRGARGLCLMDGRRQVIFTKLYHAACVMCHIFLSEFRHLEYVSYVSRYARMGLWLFHRSGKFSLLMPWRCCCSKSVSLFGPRRWHQRQAVDLDLEGFVFPRLE